jgi:glycosyltransferase involved in cell wall biosynthesis
MPQSGSIRIFMMDLLSVVPYYTGHLCGALKSISTVTVTLGTITYHLDPLYFNRTGIPRQSGLCDTASRLPAWIPSRMRQAWKGAEYIANLFLLCIRFWFSRPDIVHVQFLPLLERGMLCELWFLQFLQSIGIPIVYTVHNVLPHENGLRRRNRYESFYRSVAHLICHDVAARDELIDTFGIASHKITVIPHGPFFSGMTLSQQEARRRLGVKSADEVIVLMQGILRRYKGVLLLLNAWKDLLKSRRPARLLIAGPAERELAAEVIGECKRLELTHSVDLRIGFVGIEELALLHNAADILVYPYQSVTTSGALMTGLQFGRAIAASDLAAFKEILDDEREALLFAPGDTKGLTEALGRLIDDAGLRERLAEGSLKRAQRFAGWPEIAQRTFDCYQNVLSETAVPCGTGKSACDPLCERRGAL